MGNYGNTLDRWFRRAALVVWPNEKSFVARAEAGPAWALRTLLDRIDAGALDGARADAASLEPYWLHVEPALLAPALRVAAGLRDATIAEVVAKPFRLEMLTAEHAPLVATVAREYGDRWLLNVIDGWQALNRFAGLDRLTWITEALLPLCQALREYDADPIADGCADRVWRWLSSRIDTWIGHAHPEQRRTNLAELGLPLARFLEAASDELGATIVEALDVSGDNVVELLVPVLRAHRPPSASALVAIAHDCRRRLIRLIDRPARTAGDWSILWTGCGCELCDRLAEFLGARSEGPEEWPLAKPGRQHVHQQIDAAGLPVRHVTRRQGRPYTLLLTKTEDLFRHEDEVRRQARTDLAWLRSVFE